MSTSTPWPTRPLKECARWYSGGTPNKASSSYWGGTIPWISAKSMGDFFISDSEEYITEEGAQNGTRLVPENTILFVVRGMSLKTEFRIGITTRPVTFNQDLKALVAVEDVAPLYLAYAIKAKTEEILSLVGEAGHGTGVLPTDRIQALEIPVPPVAEQRQIAHILRMLDEKIELNGKISQTLEAIARAIYKAWFVDFEPVRAKIAGRWEQGTSPPELSAHLHHMFPEHLVNSAGGRIPEKWNWVKLSHYADLNPEAWSKNSYPDQIEYVDLANTKWGKIESTAKYSRDEAPSRAQRILKIGDTIIGTVRPGNGSYTVVRVNGLTGSTGFAVLRPKQPQNRELTYLAATASENIHRMTHLADGAAYPAVRPDVVSSTTVVQPDDQTIIREFSRITSPFLDRIGCNSEESEILALLRDALLPKLITGEIRVKDAERIVGSVV